ncbi:MAG: 5,10-methylenetetrahydrofolate reductase, partial [Actinomycetota bacterium]|nr:5,10-methylenetetrahydrofolate reductase [Actinomycetota bacterium]
MAALLDRPRYEVLPLTGTAEQVEQHVPTSLPVTVTASPRRGLEPTLELTERL